MRILGIEFFNGSVEAAIVQSLRGGLLVVPSGPNLAAMSELPGYKEAVTGSDMAIADSGLMALLWRLRGGRSITRISGLRFLTEFIQQPLLKEPGASYWVMPDAGAALTTRQWLAGQGIQIDADYFYSAPQFGQGPYEDAQLLTDLESLKPRVVILNIAGGKQEPLGYWLREQLSYRPSIICTGAAIAFLTGQQANIPVWADRLYLGWLMRILQQPGVFLPRYLKAFKLIWVVLRHGATAP